MNHATEQFGYGYVCILLFNDWLSLKLFGSSKEASLSVERDHSDIMVECIFQNPPHQVSRCVATCRPST
jgi:hypothetical protein